MDLIRPHIIGAGSDGQVLTTVSGETAWAAPPSGGSGGSGTWALLYDGEVANASEIDLTLGANYRYLRAVVTAMAPSATYGFIAMQLNGDTGANYHVQRAHLSPSLTSNHSLARDNFPMSPSTAPAGQQMFNEWLISKTATGRPARINVHGGSADGSSTEQDLVHGYWANASALINRVRFYNGSATGALPYIALLLEGRA